MHENQMQLPGIPKEISIDSQEELYRDIHKDLTELYRDTAGSVEVMNKILGVNKKFIDYADNWRLLNQKTKDNVQL